MKLYYSSGACSLAPHILLEEAAMTYQAIAVNLREKTFEGGGDFRKINPKGYVPTLELDNQDILTENAVILQYIADQKADRKLIPAYGTMERYHTLEKLNFVATELHKSFAPLFDPSYPDEAKQKNLIKISMRFEQIDATIPKDGFVMGQNYSVVDPYLFTMLKWAKGMKIDVERFPKLQGLYEKIQARPATAKVLKLEGLS